MRESIQRAVGKLGANALTEENVARHVRPLFSRALAQDRIYLANHTLGRPLDVAEEDIAEGARLWGEQLRGAWDAWLAEESAYRAALAGLLGVADARLVVPKASAGQALRTVLHLLPFGATVLTTDAEFASVSVVLAQFHALGRLRVERTAATAEALAEGLRLRPQTRLVVVSQVLFADGRVVAHLPELAASCRAHGAELLVDCYHALGVLPFTMKELGCSYLIGGCYKYLRGGPGAAFLALSPEVQERKPLDTGWFALASGENAWGANGPGLRAGGDAWLEGTPAVLPYYAARAGLAFTAAAGVARLRAYAMEQLCCLKAMLKDRGIASDGGDMEHGAFLTVPSSRTEERLQALARQGVIADARGGCVRLCPDVLTTRDELRQAVDALAS